MRHRDFDACGGIRLATTTPCLALSTNTLRIFLEAYLELGSDQTGCKVRVACSEHDKSLQALTRCSSEACCLAAACVARGVYCVTVCSSEGCKAHFDIHGGVCDRFALGGAVEHQQREGTVA